MAIANRDIQHGMTLIELVTVILVIGILSVIAVSRFSGPAPFEASGYFQTSLAAVHYAQKLALASGCDIRVAVDATGYQLNQWNNGTACSAGVSGLLPVTQPGSGAAFTQAPPASVGISGSLQLYFDGIGRPHDAGSGTLLAAPASVVIGGRTLTVENETGYTRCTVGCS